MDVFSRAERDNFFYLNFLNTFLWHACPKENNFALLGRHSIALAKKDESITRSFESFETSLAVFRCGVGRCMRVKVWLLPARKISPILLRPKEVPLFSYRILR